MRDEQSSERHNGSVQLGKRSRATKSRMTKGSTNHPTGYGLYINENTGQTILNVSIILLFLFSLSYLMLNISK